MTEARHYPLYWNEALVGYLESPVTDQYYVAGRWVALDTETTQRFLKRAANRDFLGAASSEDMIWVQLGEDDTDYQVILFSGDELTLRLDVDVDD